MRGLFNGLATALIAGLLTVSAPLALGQKPKMSPPPAPMQPAPSAANNPNGQQVIVVEPVRVFDPAFGYPYPYWYPPEYMSNNYGYVKLKTDLKNANVYVDGGFADKISKAKKFALRPGNHDITVKDTEGATIFSQKVNVLVGKTTELKVSG